MAWLPGHVSSVRQDSSRGREGSSQPGQTREPTCPQGFHLLGTEEPSEDEVQQLPDQGEVLPWRPLGQPLPVASLMFSPLQAAARCY